MENKAKQKRKVEVSLECSRNTSPPHRAWPIKSPCRTLYVLSTGDSKQAMVTLKVA